MRFGLWAHHFCILHGTGKNSADRCRGGIRFALCKGLKPPVTSRPTGSGRARDGYPNNSGSPTRIRLRSCAYCTCKKNANKANTDPHAAQ
jgi:hypothetical protein